MISRRKSFGSPSFFFPFFVSDFDDACDGSDLYDLGCIWFWKNLKVMKNTWVFLIFLDFSLCLIWKILEREKGNLFVMIDGCFSDWLFSDCYSAFNTIYTWKSRVSLQRKDKNTPKGLWYKKTGFGLKKDFLKKEKTK